jgi:acetyl-CoA C-acetyltransferase
MSTAAPLRWAIRWPATGVRLTITLARELQHSGLRYGISSACVGGGQGIALLLENPDAG